MHISPIRTCRVLLGLAAVVFLLHGSFGCDNSPNTSQSPATPPESTRTIDYYGDRSLTVPAIITRVASGWNAQNAIIAMLGYGDRIVATTDIIRNNATFRKMVPSIQDAVLCFRGSDANIEELLKVRPDVLFVPEGTNADRFASLSGYGIPVARLRGNALQAIVERTVITGRILGKDAYNKALRYQSYFNAKVAQVTARVAKIPDEKRLKVYHAGGSMLNTSGRPSLNQDWMDLAGAINIAENWFDGPAQRSSTVSLEQIVGADPDVIVTMRPETAEEIRQDPRWATVSAVRKGRIHVNPKGMFWWCRETSEEALQFLWLAKTLYPHHFEDIDMKRETRNFYRDFFGFDLTDAEIESFLHPEARSKKSDERTHQLGTPP